MIFCIIKCNKKRNKTFLYTWKKKTHSELCIFADDHGDDESMTVLAELEKIDDDCDRHGIQFVKIDDKKAATAFGIDEIPAIVYFEKQIPNVYDGNKQFSTKQKKIYSLYPFPLLILQKLFTNSSFIALIQS